MATILNAVGLLLGIIGVILLFKYGMPPVLFLNHVKVKESYPDNKEKTYNILSKIGLGFIITGFGCQFCAIGGVYNFLSSLLVF
jgi:hypothetical protein